MKRTLIITLLMAAPGMASAANYATCLLDELPGIQNDSAAAAAVQHCASKYPGRWQTVSQGEGRGLFGYESGAECAVRKAGDTRSLEAAGIIRNACNHLYDRPKDLLDEFGISVPQKP